MNKKKFKELVANLEEPEMFSWSTDEHPLWNDLIVVRERGSKKLKSYSMRK